MPMVHNRGKIIGSKDGATKTVARKIIFPAGWDEYGKPLMDGKKQKTEALLPGQHKQLTEEQYQHIVKNCPGEIVNLDDIKDLRGQFEEKKAEVTKTGWVPPEEVDALVAKKVAEALDAAGKDVGTKDGAGKQRPVYNVADMDRSELIALIEKEGLPIEYKNFKAPGALKAAVIEALDGKAASEAA